MHYFRKEKDLYPGGPKTYGSCGPGSPTLVHRRIRLKRQCHEIFCFWFFSSISFPPAPEYPIRTVSNFFENSQRYSQVKVHHRYQRHRWQICHRCQRRRRQNCHRYQRHRRQILSPVPLVLLTPVENLVTLSL